MKQDNSIQEHQFASVHNDNKEVYFFRCMECGFKERIPIFNDADMDIQNYLDKHLISSGCHQGCGTMRWGVFDKNGCNII